MLTKKFMRPSGEKVDSNKLINIITEYILQDVNASYEFTVGTDSQNFDRTKMVEEFSKADSKGRWALKNPWDREYS